MAHRCPAEARDDPHRSRREDRDGSVVSTVRRTVLPGGLRVVTEAMPAVRSVTFGIWVGVGSRDEAPTLAGASHYLEHLLFKGTPTRTRAGDLRRDRRGRRRDQRLHRQGVHLLLRAGARRGPAAGHRRAQRHGHLLADHRRGRRGRARRDPRRDRHARRRPRRRRARPLRRDGLGTGARSGRPILGTVESIRSPEPRPDRALLPHPVPPREHGGRGRRQRRPRRRRTPGPQGVRARRTSSPTPPCGPCPVRRADRPSAVRGGGGDASPGRPSRPTSCSACPALARTDDRRFALGVLNAALGGGMSSRLFQEVREKRGLAYSVYSFASHYADTGMFGVYAGCLPTKVDEVLGRAATSCASSRRTASPTRSSSAARASSAAGSCSAWRTPARG